MPGTNPNPPPVFEWREWLAFFGYVAASAVVISVLLAGVVLVVSTNADESREATSLTPVRGDLARPPQRPG